MKKKIVVLLCLAMVLAMAGCGSKKTDSAESSTSDESGTESAAGEDAAGEGDAAEEGVDLPNSIPYAICEEADFKISISGEPYEDDEAIYIPMEFTNNSQETLEANIENIIANGYYLSGSRLLKAEAGQTCTDDVKIYNYDIEKCGLAPGLADISYFRFEYYVEDDETLEDVYGSQQKPISSEKLRIGDKIEDAPILDGELLYEDDNVALYAIGQPQTDGNRKYVKLTTLIVNKSDEVLDVGVESALINGEEHAEDIENNVYARVYPHLMKAELDDFSVENVGLTSIDEIESFSVKYYIKARWTDAFNVTADEYTYTMPAKGE